jgi:branched-chain amino acid transport system substrate-binding protein
MKRKRFFFGLLALALVVLFTFVACSTSTETTTPAQNSATTTTTVKPAPATIRLGQAIALSGPYTAGAAVTQIPPTDMWIKEVNAAGGLYVKEYDKKIPLELIRYDDKSETGTVVRLVEKLILEDKVDLLLGPWGTGQYFAVAPVINKYHYPVVGPTVDSLQLRAMSDDIPYLFVILNQPPEKSAAMVDLAKELGVKTMVAAHHQDLHGIEYAGGVVPNLAGAGVDVLLYKSFPLGSKDLSPLLKEMKAANPDAAFFFCYPDETFLITQQAIEVGFNPKLFYATIGVAFSPYRKVFGAATVEGMMGAGAWNPDVPYAGAREFWDRMVAYAGADNTDWYGNAFSYAANQVLQQAIEKTGSIDREKLKEAMATETFNTVLGPVKFVNQFNIQSPGEVGQWQNGEFEIVAGKDKRTAQPIYPKPPWPKP